MTYQPRIFDKLSNALASIGIPGRDKSVHTQWTFTPIGGDQIEYSYRSDWLTRKIVDIPAQDSTRMWRSWQAEQDEITKLEGVERVFDIQNKVYQALRMARLYGGACLIFGGGDTTQDDMTKPLDVDSVDADWLKFVHVFSRYNIGTGAIIRDILSPWFGEPEYYSPSVFVGKDMPLLQIHPSWVVRFIGAEYSDPMMIGDGWGDTVLQALAEAIQNAGVVSSAIAGMVYEGKFDVIKVPELAGLANTQEGMQQLANRWAAVNVGKSYVNSIVMDKEEEWQRVGTNFGGMPDVLRTYLLMAAGAADIPATRLIGQSPVGMNATGDADLRNYYDRLKSDQETKIQPRLSRFDEVLIRSALGDRPPELFYEWNPLWQMDEQVKAMVDLQKAQAAQIEAAIGLVPVSALAKGRQNQLIEDGVYPGLEGAIEEAELEGDLSPIEEEPAPPPSTGTNGANGAKPPSPGSVEGREQGGIDRGAEESGDATADRAIADKLAPGATLSECIREMYHNHPDWDRDRIIAACYNMTGG
jgi:phage-related protein (TIGR01555 family)